MHVRLTSRGRKLCKVLGKAGAWVAGFFLAIDILAAVFHGIGSAFSSSPSRVQNTPVTYTPFRNWLEIKTPAPVKQPPVTTQVPAIPIPLAKSPRITDGSNPLTMPQLSSQPNPIKMPQLTTTPPVQQDNPPSPLSATFQSPQFATGFLSNMTLSAPSVTDDVVPVDAKPPAAVSPAPPPRQEYPLLPWHYTAADMHRFAEVNREFLLQWEATHAVIERDRQVQVDRTAAERQKEDVRGREAMRQDGEPIHITKLFFLWVTTASIMFNLY